MEVEQRERIGPVGPEKIQILANLWVNRSQQGSQATAHFFLNVTMDCKKITGAYWGQGHGHNLNSQSTLVCLREKAQVQRAENRARIMWSQQQLTPALKLVHF